MSGNMVQYGVWPNCSNACKFCLLKDKTFYNKEKQLQMLDNIKKNIDYVDWKNTFDYGISLLGGEIYFITDKDLQASFLELIDIIIEKILKVSTNPQCKYSTVTNGIYDPEFLYKVVDKIVNAVGIEKVDINFSYDLKYRFKNEKTRQLCLNNINAFHDRYNYCVGVQMILTQYVIDAWKNKEFEVNSFLENVIPGNQLCFLYPHPVRTGFSLPDFNFKRNNFLNFIRYLKHTNYNTYLSFLYSTKNSCTFKYTGLKTRTKNDYTELPQLSDDKEILNSCGHSILYQCYTDSDKCMLCDLNNLDEEAYV